jgi:hypothetical protein
MIQRCLAVGTQIFSFLQELPEQAIDVLAATALPACTASRFTLHPGKHHKTRFALDRCANTGLIHGTNNEVALPVASHLTRTGIYRPVANYLLRRNLQAAVTALFRAPRTAF